MLSRTEENIRRQQEAKEQNNFLTDICPKKQMQNEANEMQR